MALVLFLIILLLNALPCEFLDIEKAASLLPFVRGFRDDDNDDVVSENTKIIELIKDLWELPSVQESSNIESSSSDWNQQRKLPAVTTWNQVGSSIDGLDAGDNLQSTSLSADGTIVAVGSRRNDRAGIDAGNVRILQDPFGPSDLVGNILEGSTAGDGFGRAVALSLDGTILAVGAPDASNATGYVRVYELVGGTWAQLGADLPGPDTESLYGFSVSLSGDGSAVAIGASDTAEGDGLVEVFDFDGTNWLRRGSSFTGGFDDQLGFSVALSEDGSTVVMGARAGRYVRVYTHNETDWSLVGSEIGSPSSNQFGFSVDIACTGTVVAIGAPGGGTDNTGQASVYELSGGVWVLRQTIDGVAVGDGSGYAVSLSSSGSVLAVGAVLNDGAGSAGAERGHTRVYEYDGATYNQLGQDIDGVGDGDYFGLFVSLAKSGSTISVAAPFNDDNGPDAGQVRVFEVDTALSSPTPAACTPPTSSPTSGPTNQPTAGPTSRPTFLPTAEPSSGPTSGPTMGPTFEPTSGPTSDPSAGPTSGPTGMPTSGPTTVPTSRPTSGPTSQPTVDPTSGPTSVPTSVPTSYPTLWPTSVPSISPTFIPTSGPTSIPTVSPTSTSPVTWNQVGSSIDGSAPGDNLQSASLSADGLSIAVGSRRNEKGGTDAGNVRVLRDPFGDPSDLVGNILEGSAGDGFGRAVALSLDGTILAVGAPDASNATGYVRVYELVGGTWAQLGADLPGPDTESLYGFSVSLSGDGSAVAIGASDTAEGDGLVEVFDFDGTNWLRRGSSFTGGFDDQLGFSVALSEDGATVVMGARAGRYVRVYTHNEPDWSLVGSEIGSPSSNQFGFSVDIACTGTVVAIGAPGGGTDNTGQASVYELSGGVWVLRQTIDGEGAGDLSGYAVSLSSSGSVLAVGAVLNDGAGSAGAERGHTRVYEYDGATYNQLGQDIDGVGGGDYFGLFVSLSKSGSILAVAAPFNDDNGPDAGQVRVFEVDTPLSSPTPAACIPPSSSPTSGPTNQPTAGPTSRPTFLPTAEPSSGPTSGPTMGPTYRPTSGPTSDPSAGPTSGPTGMPTSHPTSGPTNQPTAGPTSGPTGMPTSEPSSGPTSGPTTVPTSRPTSGPTSQPTVDPTSGPTSVPTSVPTLYPTSLPTSVPTISPTFIPTSGPTSIPTASPTSTSPVTWNQVGAPIDGSAPGDNLQSASLSADGLSIAVGSRRNDKGGIDAGNVRVLRDPFGDPNDLVGNILEGSAGDGFGRAVALSLDGTILAVGAPDASNATGYVRVYELVGGSWAQLGADLPGPGSNSLYGFAVSLSGDGRSVAIGASDTADGDGLVDVFDYNGTNWIRRGASFTGGRDDQLGFSVALSEDGSTVAMGARIGRYVRVYTHDGTDWSLVASEISSPSSNQFGFSVDIACTGTIVAIGAPGGGTNNTGQASVYELSGGVWVLRQTIDGEAVGDGSGYAVSLSSSGSVLAVGAVLNDGAGSAGAERGHTRVYEYDGVTYNQLGQDIDGVGDGDYFGLFVSLSKSGSTLAVAAPFNDDNGPDAGQVRVFEVDTPLSSPTPAACIPPSSSPTNGPTNQPTAGPTSGPTGMPSSEPSSGPTSGPTTGPTSQPTVDPTSGPTSVPTSVPTSYPTLWPTSVPTTSPTFIPTSGPTSIPTAGPTTSPTSVPTTSPTSVPTGGPTVGPTGRPTSVPTSGPTSEPTSLPSSGPTSVPSSGPTPHPTSGPTKYPTAGPTTGPTSAPSSGPTAGPTSFPTSGPTGDPTVGPTSGPTSRPTSGPTLVPTEGPTSVPTSSPTSRPTAGPTSFPTSGPTSIPTDGPTSSPTSAPTDGPTTVPTSGPTWSPTSGPTLFPTSGPTSIPTDGPTSSPTSHPTEGPTSFPTSDPTSGPTSGPTYQPTNGPTIGPTIQPTSGPSSRPSSQPTADLAIGYSQTFGPTLAAASLSGSNGDPHFRKWNGGHYEYHGQCDIVLVKDESFADGLGLEVHIRTKLVRFWSFIKNAAIRIGDDTLEMQGSHDPFVNKSNNHYWINSVYQGKVTTLGGFPVTATYEGKRKAKRWFVSKYGGGNKISRSFEIDLSSKYPGQKIVIGSYKEFVRVDFHNAQPDAFGNCVGMLGNFITGQTLARDGVTELTDYTDLGHEWQVLPQDGILFHDVSDPQFPDKCIEPDPRAAKRHRRLGESSITDEQAEEACSSILDVLDRKDCVSDVLATQDLTMVEAY